MKKRLIFVPSTQFSTRAAARNTQGEPFSCLLLSKNWRLAFTVRCRSVITPAEAIVLTPVLCKPSFVCTFVNTTRYEKATHTQTVFRLSPRLRRRNRHAQGANSAPRSRTCQNLPRLHLAPRSDDRGGAIRNSTRGEVTPHFPTFYFSTFNLPAPFAG